MEMTLKNRLLCPILQFGEVTERNIELNFEIQLIQEALVISISAVAKTTRDAVFRRLDWTGLVKRGLHFVFKR